MASSGNLESCPKCGSPIREGDVYCSKCSYKLVKTKIPEEKVAEIKVNHWLGQAKSTEKWGLASFAIGFTFVLLYFLVFQSFSSNLTIWMLVCGALLICLAAIFGALSLYIHSKLQKGELPSG